MKRQTTSIERLESWRKLIEVPHTITWTHVDLSNQLQSPIPPIGTYIALSWEVAKHLEERIPNWDAGEYMQRMADMFVGEGKVKIFEVRIH